MPATKPTKSNVPSDRFRDAMKKILSVDKTELVRRETAYKEQRKIRSHHRHR